MVIQHCEIIKHLKTLKSFCPHILKKIDMRKLYDRATFFEEGDISKKKITFSREVCRSIKVEKKATFCIFVTPLLCLK